MKLQIKKLYPDTKMPFRRFSTDAGIDLFAHSILPMEGRRLEYGTGIAVNIPEGYVGLLFPRSSVSNTDMLMANCVGVVDSGYTGEIKVRFRVAGQKVYSVGERICQLVIIQLPELNFNYEEVTEFDNTERGDNGFGSTGLN